MRTVQQRNLPPLCNLNAVSSRMSGQCSCGEIHLCVGCSEWSVPRALYCSLPVLLVAAWAILVQPGPPASQGWNGRGAGGSLFSSGLLVGLCVFPSAHHEVISAEDLACRWLSCVLQKRDGFAVQTLQPLPLLLFASSWLVIICALLSAYKACDKHLSL